MTSIAGPPAQGLGGVVDRAMRARLPLAVLGLSVIASGALMGSGCPETPPAPPMTLGLGAPEHESFFPIGTGAHHELERAAVYRAGNITCSACHPPGPTFEEFTCLTCHAGTNAAENQLDTAHASARGYSKEDASCYACHPRGEAVPQAAEGEGEGEVFDHDRDAFPVIDANATHNGITCAQCHADVGGDYSVTLCWGCHQGDTAPTIFEKHQPAQPAGVGTQLGAIFDGDHSETACRECHATTPTFRLSNHEGFMFPQHPASPECKDCHRSRQEEPKEWAIDFQSTTCTNTTGCHSSEPTCSAANREGC